MISDESQPTGHSRPNPNGVFKFYLLSTLSDAHPIVVERGCHAINIIPSI
jgi:hypothetical protein